MEGAPLDIEEAFVTWADVEIDGATARVCGQTSVIELRIEEPIGSTFQAARLEEECQANRREGTLTRITAALVPGSPRFKMRIKPVKVA
jgi:hypothetical protein